MNARPALPSLQLTSLGSGRASGIRRKVKPRISVGLPVFNGENYLESALKSLMQQTFRDFEIVICDNASTDRTREICADLAAGDSRIQYHRNGVNLGAAPNFARAFRLSRGTYFKWAAHDDLCAPTFLERCAEVLDREPSVVLCYPKAQVIDEHGALLRIRGELGLDMPEPNRRFIQLLYHCIGSPPIFGLMRASTLRKTRLIGNYYASDQVLNAELALHGRLYELDEALLVHREHPGRSVHAHRSRVSATRWFNATTSGRILAPSWGVFREYVSAISRAPLPAAERLRCYVHMLRWLRLRRRELTTDLLGAVRVALSPGDSTAAAPR